MQHDITKSRT